MFLSILFLCSSYNNPAVEEDIIEEHAIRIMHTVDRRLSVGSKHSDKYIRILFRHDVFRKLFKGKDNLYEGDFDPQYFRPGWEASLKKYIGVNRTIYNGSKVVFPILVRPYLTWTKKNRFFKENNCKFNQKPLIFVEMLRLYIETKDC